MTTELLLLNFVRTIVITEKPFFPDSTIALNKKSWSNQKLTLD